MPGKTYPDTLVRHVVIWENLCADEFLRRTEVDEQNTLENQVKHANDR